MGKIKVFFLLYIPLEVRLEGLYYPLLFLFNYNMTLLGVISPTYFGPYKRNSKVYHIKIEIDHSHIKLTLTINTCTSFETRETSIPRNITAKYIIIPPISIKLFSLGLDNLIILHGVRIEGKGQRGDKSLILNQKNVI